MTIDRQLWWQLPQKVRFVVAGTYNTAFGIAAFAALYYVLNSHLHYLLIGVFSNFLAVCSAFVVHRFLVFRHTGNWQSAFARFYAGQTIALLFGTICLYLFVDQLHIRPLPAQTVITVASVALSYTVHRYYSFRITKSST